MGGELTIMKKVYFILLVVITLITGCSIFGTKTSTIGQIKVIDKGYSKDYKEAWIIAYVPNNTTKEQSFNIIVKEPMLLNFVEVGKDYFARYSKTGNNPWVLTQIRNVDIENKYEFTYLEDLQEEKLEKYGQFLNDGNTNHLIDFTPEQIVLIYMNLVMNDNFDRIYALTYDEGQLPSLDVFKDEYTMFLSNGLKDNYLQYRFYDSIKIDENSKIEDDIATVVITIGFGSTRQSVAYGLKKEENIWKMGLYHLIEDSKKDGTLEYDKQHQQLDKVIQELQKHANGLERGDYIGFIYSSDNLYKYLLAIYYKDIEYLDPNYPYNYPFNTFKELVKTYYENVDFGSIQLEEVNHSNFDIEVEFSYTNLKTNKIDHLKYHLNYGEHALKDLSTFNK